MKEITLIDECTKLKELLLIEGLIVSEDLTERNGTLPDMVRDLEILLAMRDRRVVLPAPEGPMMASIYPGLQ